MTQSQQRLVLTALLALACAPAPADTVLSDFNDTGFDYTFDDFTQTVGGSAVRLLDSNDGWGGAGIVEGFDLSTLADGRLVIDLTPGPLNGVNQFVIELIDQIDGSSTQRSGKWGFNVGNLTPGVPTTLVSQTVLSSPDSGVGDFGSLDLSQIRQWQVLGEFGSAAPFDITFDRIAVDADIPPPPPYAGAEPDAPWRAQAATQIDSIRKADLSVSVVDASGAPVPGATVSVAMQRHEFGFGSAVQGYRLRDSQPQYDQYKAKVAELFNLATLENNLKWQPWEGEWGGNWTQQGAVSALDWLNANGIEGRGHVMVWPGTDNLPADIRQMLADNNLTPAEQQTVRNRIAAHIAEVGAAADGRVGAWDVINETRTNNDLMRELAEGDQAMVTWFQQAAAADPDAKRFLNDFGILNSGGGTATPNQDQYFETLEYLQAEGAPIDGVGFQAHFTPGDLTGPEQLWTIFDRFEQLGLDMQITEFDLNTTDEQLQAQYTRDFMTAVFAHGGIDDFIMWGFWEGAHWRPDAAMFRDDWSIKPNGEAYLDLVFDEWWTDEEADADTQGEATVRGFKGDYSVTASAGGVSESVDAVLAGDGASLLVTLPTLVGDYNGDGRVDAADYTVWRDTFGSTTNLAADGDNSGQVDAADYDLWSDRFGNVAAGSHSTSVPEPTTLATLAAALLCLTPREHRHPPSELRAHG